MGWAETQGNSSLSVGKALLKALLWGLEKWFFVNVQSHWSPKKGGSWEGGDKRGDGKREGDLVMLHSAILPFFFFPPG